MQSNGSQLEGLKNSGHFRQMVQFVLHSILPGLAPLYLRKQEKEEKEKAKVQFGGVFSRGGSLYTDKAGEAAARKKKKEVAK